MKRNLWMFRAAKLAVLGLWLAIFTFANNLSAASIESARLRVGSHVAEVDGFRFHYVVQGRGPLLIVQAPGWGIGTAYLRNGLAQLSQHFTLVTFDPRGTEDSSPVASTSHLTNADLAEDLERLRLYWGLKKMDLIAHSNGSAIAILYAERHPDEVGKLVLIGSQLLGYQDEADDVERAEQERRKQDPAFAFYLAHISDPTPEGNAEFTKYFRERAGYYFYNPQRDLPTLLVQLTGTLNSSVNRAFVEEPPPSEAPPLSDLKKIRARTLVVVGRQDPVCPLRESMEIQAGIRDAKLVAIDHSAHFPWIEQPAPFFAALETFLNTR